MQTFSMLILASQNYCIDPATTSTTALSDTQTFIKSEINKTIKYIFSRVRNYKTQLPPQTMTTVADQVYYHNPPGMDTIEAATMTVGDIPYKLKTIHSQEEWNRLQMVTSASTIPQFIFPRKYDFGLYPTPQDAYTVTLVSNPMPKDLSFTDETAGTVSITNNSRTVEGTLTTWTANMAGRWFRATDDQDWYRISSVTDSDTLTLQSYFEGLTDTSSAYVIGEVPEIPEELHEIIPYRVAGIYYQTLKRDPQLSKSYFNLFYTGDPYNDNRWGRVEGGLMGAINRYKTMGRDNSQLVTMGVRDEKVSEIWTTTLS